VIGKPGTSKPDWTDAFTDVCGYDWTQYTTRAYHLYCFEIRN
jgi:hypothetical protein